MTPLELRLQFDAVRRDMRMYHREALILIIASQFTAVSLAFAAATMAA